MGWLGVLIGVAAGVLFYKAGSLGLMGVCIAITALNFWSYGVMHNQAVESAKHRAGYVGGFYDLTESDLRAVSGRLTQVNMATTLGLIGLLVTALFYTF